MDHRIALGVALTVVTGLWVTGGQRAAAQGATTPSLVGAWTINKDLSDQPQDGSSDDRGGDQRPARRGGGGFGGGGFGGGRRGGGGGGRGGDGARGGFDPEQMARVRNALRDITNTPEHLTIVQTDSMIILTGPDGRTTRLSADGKKIKDESAKLERKTKWDAGKLVSEISGLAGMKLTELYWVDPGRHQLHVTVHNDDDRRPLMINRIYDADALR